MMPAPADASEPWTVVAEGTLEPATRHAVAVVRATHTAADRGETPAAVWVGRGAAGQGLCVFRDPGGCPGLGRSGGGPSGQAPAPRVTALVDAGAAHPFAPAGRRFREWAALAPDDAAVWTDLLEEALEYVRRLGEGAETGGR